MATFVGKFRGTVVSNADPLQLGRLQLQVPDVDASPLGFALPCFPPGVFAIPATGASVWVEFEQGDISRPIWTGVFYQTAADVPAAAAKLPPNLPGFAVGVAGGIVLEGAQLASVGDGAGALVNVALGGVGVSNGKGATIQLQGAAFDVNSGGLTVV